MSGGQRFYPWFDWLRALLSLGVFIAHAVPDQTVYPQLGRTSVHVFFALSGFLIGGILIRSDLASLPRFFFNRSTRIWIPYGLAIALLFLGCLVKKQHLDGKLAEFFFYKVTFVYNLFGTQQLALHEQMPLQGTGNHFWSICVEEQFYLFAPFVLVLFPKWRVPALVFVWLSNFHAPHMFAGIALGGLLAISQQSFGDWFMKARGRLSVAVLFVVVALAEYGGYLTYESAIPLLSVSAVAILGQRGSQGAVGRFLGGVSYPFYLNHWVGLVWVTRIASALQIAPLWARVIAFLISFGFAAAHYVVVDKNIAKHRDAWFTTRRGRVCFATGIALFGIGVVGGLLLS